ncbi:MAG: GlcNAc-PI de-N-acetylase [Chloroflexi bacterium]|nr:MAG: GlcNAc-PI de-N-acetylase [Chloroflexota bacterium]
MSPSASRTLLVVFAHPDDESFGPGGTLARYAAEGVAVHLICATRGEAGEAEARYLDGYNDLAERRLEELRCAGRVLGLAGIHFLDYRDSGMPGSPANRHPQALIVAPVEEVAAQIANLMRALRPQVVLTHDPGGGYGHPDHVAVHRATVAAFHRLLRERPDGYAPERLYFTVFDRRQLAWTVRLMPLFGMDPTALGRNRDINLKAALERALPVTTRVDVRDYLEVKQRAAACHQSQIVGGPGTRNFYGRLPRWLVRRWRSTETFHRAYPPYANRRVERDLFPLQEDSSVEHLGGLPGTEDPADR